MANRTETNGGLGIGPFPAPGNPDGFLKQTENGIAERLREKKEPSLGEFNPLLFPPDLGNPEAVEAITLATTRLIARYGGIQPELRVTFVTMPYNQPPQPKLIARFAVATLAEEQLVQIEDVAKQIYGTAARIRKNSSGNAIPPSNYPELENKKKRGGQQSPLESGRLLGWYMGPDPEKVSTAHEGIFVHRDLGRSSMASYVRGYSPNEWFFKEELKDPITERSVKTSYNVEIREASRYQTDIVEEIVQVASILANGKAIDHRQLLYEVYNDLNRLGLKKRGRDSIYGLDETIDYIERVLFLPLSNIDLSSSMVLKAGSVLTVGVPGTGKTLIAEHFLGQDTGVFVVPVDPLLLASDMAAPPEKKTILPRISQVFNDTQIPVVLHMDDVENIAANEQQINSTLLNLMAGVRENGFYVLASTNYPEKLSTQLLQPQRFAHLIYFGLPEDQTRKGILDVHALKASIGIGHPLFASEEERDIILEGLTAHTKGYTSRFLAEICTRAKYHLLKRVSETRGRKIGLSEEDMEGVFFTMEDWARSFNEVSRMYDMDATVKRDKELAEFVEKHNRLSLGFVNTMVSRKGETLLATFDDLVAARLKQ